MKNSNWNEKMITKLGSDFLGKLINNMDQDTEVQFTLIGTVSKPNYQLSHYDAELDYEGSPEETSMVPEYAYNGKNHKELASEYSNTQLSKYFTYLNIVEIFDKLPKSRDLAETLLEFHFMFKKMQLEGDPSLPNVIKDAEEGWEFMLCEIMKGGIDTHDAFHNAIRGKSKSFVNNINGKSSFYKLTFTNNNIDYPKMNGGWELGSNEEVLFFDNEECADLCAMQLAVYNTHTPKNYTDIVLSNCPVLESGLFVWNKRNFSELDILSL